MHPAWTYMLRDLGGSVLGVLLFPAVLFAPGYVVGHCCNITRFRSRALSEKLAWSVLLSFAVGTLCTVGGTWLGGAAGGASVIFLFGLAAALLLIRMKAWVGTSVHSLVPYASFAVLTCAVVILSLVDVGMHDQLRMSVTAYDNALRTAFVDAVLRTGVPPVNPVYWPGHDAPMRYYYFWYVVCAGVAKLGHISARQALIASSVWAVFGVAASIALFGRHVLEWRGDELKQRWWVALALLSATGLDGLIALLVFAGSGIVARDIEWWSLAQVSSWADTFLWVPHHAAALACSVLCLVLLSLAANRSCSDSRWVLGTLGGLAYASSFGLSTYVSISLTLILAAWLVAQFFREEGIDVIKTCAIAGLTAALCLVPFLAQLLKPVPGARVKAGSVVQFGVRELLPAAVLADLPGIRGLSMSHPRVAHEVSAALLLAPSYFLELGFFAVALLVLQRKREKASGEKVLLYMTWTGLLAVSVLQSGVIAMNDYAVRGSLLPQFFLLFAGVLALESSKNLTRIFLTGLLIVGVCGTVYQIMLLRTFLPIHDRPNQQQYSELAHRNYVLRDTYAEMQKHIPENARVQFSIPNTSYTGLAQQMNLGRQMIVDSEYCNDSFGGEHMPCASIQASLATLFSDRSVSAAEAVALCKAVGADYLTAAAWDSVWRFKEGWVWTLPVVVARSEMRVVSCTSPPGK